ncbi:hypothetical protein EIP91_003600 [Steccherinum ochraceum]|uniref:DDE Tnp4 domain-containing protein n=1 Tax=Steccherinum ochraceum TaxID=92696 RepID=A0A4R0RIQ2_9APHY|nr:hypothetical protein EIP91_003600 [Steccherinum ochraceum]
MPDSDVSDSSESEDEELLLSAAFMQMEEDIAIDGDYEARRLRLATTTFLLSGVKHVRRKRAAARPRLYLRRSELLPDPRNGTPWQQLYASKNDRAFITTMGVDVDTFHYLLFNGFAYRWNKRTIPRADVRPHGIPRLGRRSLDAAGALALVLHWLNSTMREVSLCQIFALIPSTVNRYLDNALDILDRTLLHIPEAEITWPEDEEVLAELTEIVQMRHGRLHGAFGVVDGLNLPVQVSEDEDLENATYNGWLHGHFISNVFSFSPKGSILHCTLNAPGSWHDSRVARLLYEKLRTRTPPGYYLVADTAFPAMQDRIRTPPKQNARPPAGMNATQTAEWNAFNRELLSFRQAAEWGMRELQGSFGRLRIPLPIADKHRRLKLLTVVARMHQIRVHRVGISQIRNVYVPLWRGETDELEQVWLHWEDMLFKDVRRLDRVSRFHRSQ